MGMKLTNQNYALNSFVSQSRDTWSLTFREADRVTAFENSVARKIFGPKRAEGRRDWIKLELHYLYYLLNIRMTK